MFLPLFVWSRLCLQLCSLACLCWIILWRFKDCAFVPKHSLLLFIFLQPEQLQKTGPHELYCIFSALVREGLPLLEYTARFCQLAQCTSFDDGTIKSLYWAGADYHQLRPLQNLNPAHSSPSTARRDNQQPSQKGCPSLASLTCCASRPHHPSASLSGKWRSSLSTPSLQ